MINSGELRIGNYIGCNDGVVVIMSINKYSVGVHVIGDENNNWEEALEFCQPILLNRETLSKCGFIHDARRNQWTHQIDTAGIFIANGLTVRANDRLITKEFSDKYFIETYYSGIEMKSVHQLQNFYYSLTAKELEIIL